MHRCRAALYEGTGGRPQIFPDAHTLHNECQIRGDATAAAGVAWLELCSGGLDGVCWIKLMTQLPGIREPKSASGLRCPCHGSATLPCMQQVSSRPSCNGTADLSCAGGRDVLLGMSEHSCLQTFGSAARYSYNAPQLQPLQLTALARMHPQAPTSSARQCCRKSRSQLEKSGSLAPGDRGGRQLTVAGQQGFHGAERSHTKTLMSFDCAFQKYQPACGGFGLTWRVHGVNWELVAGWGRVGHAAGCLQEQPRKWG